MTEMTRTSGTTLRQTEDQPAQAGTLPEWAAQALIPPVDIHEVDDAVIVTADMPGVTADSLSVELEDRVLDIQGEIRLDMPEGVSASFAEIRASRYHRRFTIGHAIDREGIEARISHGVLEVRLPKAATHRRRRIEITAA